MQSQQLAIAVLVSTLSLTPASPIVAQDSGNPPASTFQPGFWQPVARFDPSQPVEVKLVNDTDMVLNYDITEVESEGFQSIGAGGTSILKGFGDSANIVIYPDSSVTSEVPFTLKFKVDVSADNMATITIQKVGKDFFGHRAVNLQKTGAIFLY